MADQIRKLAEQSTQSAVDTRQLIESSLAEVEAGNRAAQRASKSIESIIGGIKAIAQSSQELSEISKDQPDDRAVHRAGHYCCVVRELIRYPRLFSPIPQQQKKHPPQVRNYRHRLQR